MDECYIKRSSPKLWRVGDEDRQVWVYKQHDENTKEDSRSEEPLENLVEIHKPKCFEGQDEHTQVIAHAAMTKFASTRG